MLKKTAERLNQLYPLIEALADADLRNKADFLRERISSPEHYVLMLGKTSSGKSTLLNGLLQKSLLCTSICPSTKALIEVVCRPIPQQTVFIRVNKEGEGTSLKEGEFKQLEKNSDSDIQRLCVDTFCSIIQQGELHVFDSPGYAALQQDADVLWQFLPQTSLIVCVIDFNRDFLREDVEFFTQFKQKITEFQLACPKMILVINKVPAGIDQHHPKILKLINKIKHHTELDVMAVFSVPLILSPNLLPTNLELWDFINKFVRSKEQEKLFADKIEGLIQLLWQDIQFVVQEKQKNYQRFANYQSSLEKDLAKCPALYKELEKDIQDTFGRIYLQAPKKMKKAEEKTREYFEAFINKAPRLQEDETKVFLQMHLNNVYDEHIDNVVANYIAEELLALDKRQQDRLDTIFSVESPQTNIDFSSYTEVTMNAGKPLLSKYAHLGWVSYAKQFAGQGGQGGMASNTARHILKQGGKLIGKRFSREMHNTVAHWVKILNKSKNSAIAVAAIIEGVFVLGELATCKWRLKRNLRKTLEGKLDEQCVNVMKQLKKSEKINLRILKRRINDREKDLKNKYNIYQQNACNYKWHEIYEKIKKTGEVA